MDSRGLPFGHPVAPNRIIANCLLAGTALHLAALYSHASSFLYSLFSLLIFVTHSPPHLNLSPLTHSTHHSHTLLTTHTLDSPLTHSTHLSHSSHHSSGTSPVHRDSTVHDLRHYTHGIQGTARRRALTTNGIVTSNRESVNLSSSARSKFHIAMHCITSHHLFSIICFSCPRFNRSLTFSSLQPYLLLHHTSLSLRNTLYRC